MPAGHTADRIHHQNIILKHIQDQRDLQGYLNSPSAGSFDENWPDRMYDMVLYFIAPHCFKLSDLFYMERLSKEATVIPICAKADALTGPERMAFEEQIRNQLTHSDGA